ncbi:ABC transporter permease [Streptomyces sp. MS1.HAVA.3]|uniref:ABC transporter permease n=1 Tax=Streptomyces caledonius TaxID=3134107 RepID=A0ABU8U2P4_9ACTN
MAVAWWELLGDGQLADHTRASLVRSFGGFGIAVAVAVPLGLLIGWYRPLADFLGPLLEVFRNTAALALLPVFVLLLGIGETSKVSIVVYACLWPVLLNTISAVRNADPTLIRLARSMDLSTPRLFQKVILPSSVPAIFTGIRLAGAVSILVLVAAEMIGAKAGLGFLINASQFNFAIRRCTRASSPSPPSAWPSTSCWSRSNAASAPGASRPDGPPRPRPPPATEHKDPS